MQLKIRGSFGVDWFMQTPSRLEFHPIIKVSMDLYKTGWLDIIAKQERISHIANILSKISNPLQEVIHVQGGQMQQFREIITFRQDMLWVHLNKETHLLHNETYEAQLYVHTQSYGLGGKVWTELRWISQRVFSADASDYFISLPGSTQSVSIRARTNERAANFTVSWIQNALLHKHYERKGAYCRLRCERHKHLGQCVKFPHDKGIESDHPQTYMLFRRQAASASHRFAKKAARTPQISWSGAASLCQKYTGYLPLLRSKSEMNEFISFMKVSSLMPQVDALYIGLHFKSSQKVSFLFLFVCHVRKAFSVRNCVLQKDDIIYRHGQCGKMVTHSHFNCGGNQLLLKM